MEDKVIKENENLDEMPGSMETEADRYSESRSSAAGADEKDQVIQKLQHEISDLKDKYLRQVADFDNFRKRNAREKIELIQTAGKDIIQALLPVLDDSERAERQLESAQDTAALKEGLSLIISKLRAILQSKGLKPMDAAGSDFNPEFHEAITEVPAASKDLQGKVVDEVEKGYYLNDKIIRFAKVVVGK